MKRLNRSNWSLTQKKLTLSFCALVIAALVLILNYWGNAFPDSDSICRDRPLMLINTISSCTEPGVFRKSLDVGGYQYSEDSFTSSRTTLNPGLDFLNITVNKYEISSCTGEARFRFVNGYLSSATFFPSDFCELNLTKNEGELKVEKGENFEGRKFFFFGDERLEKYYRNWLEFFS